MEFLDEHFGYLADSYRLERYAQALRQAVRPGDVCVDLGCGTGILGLLALRAGAGHVHLVDHEAVLELARQSMTRAGHAERCTFHRARAQTLVLPERADVVMCDHVGYFGFDYGIFDLLGDARRRLLRPGGALLPQALRLWVAGTASQTTRALVERWRREPVPTEYHWIAAEAAQSKHGRDLAPAALCSSPGMLGTLDLTVEHGEFHAWRTRLLMEREAQLDALCGWFECDLWSGVQTTNSPLAAPHLDRPQAVLPVDPPLALRAGEWIDVRVMARPSDQLIAWTITCEDGRTAEGSTWNSELVSPELLSRTRQEHIPRRTPHAQARMLVLSYCDGVRTARDIEELVLQAHPSLMPSPGETIRFVRTVLRRDTE